MKGKINKEGILERKRKSIYKKQYCLNNKDCYCCDVCVLFGEVRKVNSRSQYNQIEEAPNYVLDLCDENRLYFTDFIDERR